MQLYFDTVMPTQTYPTPSTVTENNNKPIPAAGGITNFFPSIKPGSEKLQTTGELLATDDRFSTLLTALGTAFPNGT